MIDTAFFTRLVASPALPSTATRAVFTAVRSEAIAARLRVRCLIILRFCFSADLILATGALLARHACIAQARRCQARGSTHRFLWINRGPAGGSHGELAEDSSTRSRLHKNWSLSSQSFFRVIPERIHLFEVRLLWCLATLGQSIFDELEPSLESLGRVDERILCIDPDLASEVHARKQQIAELFVNVLRIVL